MSSHSQISYAGSPSSPVVLCYISFGLIPEQDGCLSAIFDFNSKFGLWHESSGEEGNQILFKTLGRCPQGIVGNGLIKKLSKSILIFTSSEKIIGYCSNLTCKSTGWTVL